MGFFILGDIAEVFCFKVRGTTLGLEKINWESESLLWFYTSYYHYPCEEKGNSYFNVSSYFLSFSCSDTYADKQLFQVVGKSFKQYTDTVNSETLSTKQHENQFSKVVLQTV